MLKMGFIGFFLSLPRFVKKSHWETEKDKIYKMQNKNDKKKTLKAHPLKIYSSHIL